MKYPVIFTKLQAGPERLILAQHCLEESIRAFGLDPLPFPCGKKLVLLGDVLSYAREHAQGEAFIWANSDVFLTKNPFEVPDPQRPYGFHRREIPSGEFCMGVDMFYIPIKVWDKILSQDIPKLFIGASYVDWWIPRYLESLGLYGNLKGYIDHPSHPTSSASTNEANYYYQHNFRVYNQWAGRHGLMNINKPPFLIPRIGHVWGVRDAWQKWKKKKRERKRFLFSEQSRKGLCRDVFGKYVSKDNLISLATDIFWSNNYPYVDNRFPSGSVVFCKIDHVMIFFEHIRLGRRKVILITGEGDFPCDAWRQSFLPENVRHWFATNVTHPHPKVTAVPLGLSYASDQKTLQEKDLLLLRETSRDSWLYINFRLETNLSLRKSIWNYCSKHLLDLDWVTIEEPKPLGDNQHFLHQLGRHRFILAPPGFGVDTHRLWEALVAGTYPIVWRSPAMEPFSELPILFVDSIEEVSLELLQNSLPLLEKKAQNQRLLMASYWQEKIQHAHQEFLKKTQLSWPEWLAASLSYGKGMLKRRCQSFFQKVVSKKQ